MLKRIIAFLLCTVLAFSSVQMPTAKAAAPDQDEIFEILYALGWMTPNAQGDFYGYVDVTRAALAKIIMTSSSTFRGAVSSTQKTSPFKDVSFKFWGAPYISAVAETGIMYGYSDGTFKPNKSILYEEAVTAILRVLGYEESDYIGSYPTGQLTFANDLELTDGLTCTRGQAMSRYNMSRLLYNALSVESKNSNGKIYAQTLGYSRATEMLRLTDFIKDTTKGPITYINSSLESLTGLSLPTVYINGSKSDSSNLEPYSVLYYSKKSNTVWAYTQKVSGLLEKITPNRESPTSVTISGTTYSLEYSKAISAFGLDGLETGTLVTALLDKDGKIYDAFKADELYTSKLGIVTKSGTKQVTLKDGSVETRYYATVLLLDGSSIEIEQKSNTSGMIGKIVRINYSNGSISQYTSTSYSNLSGVVNADSLTWGNKTKLSKDIQILEVDEYGNHTTISLNRLDGVKLNGSDVIYMSKSANGAVDGMIIKNVCGDTAQYGHITSSSMYSAGNMPSGRRYEYTLKTSSGSCVLDHLVSNVTNGPAAFYFEGNQVKEIRSLVRISGTTISTFNYSYLETTSGVKHKIDPNATVYKMINNTRTLTSLSEAVSGNWKYTAFYDETSENGGMIRMIYIEEK